MFTLMLLNTPQNRSRGIRVCSFLGREKDHPTYLFTERHRNVMEQGPSCPTCHMKRRGETLCLQVPGWLLNTQHLCPIQKHFAHAVLHLYYSWGNLSLLGQKIRTGRKGRQEEKAGEGWARAQKQQCNESKRKLVQLLVPAPRVSHHHQERVLQGCSTAHSLSPAATSDAATQPPVAAPLPQAGTQPGAQPVPSTCHGLASHWHHPPGRIQAGQRSGAALLIRAHWFSGHLLNFFTVW